MISTERPFPAVAQLSASSLKTKIKQRGRKNKRETLQAGGGGVTYGRHQQQSLWEPWFFCDVESLDKGKKTKHGAREIRMDKEKKGGYIDGWEEKGRE